jgi:hypothetical protein
METRKIAFIILVEGRFVKRLYGPYRSCVDNIKMVLPEMGGTDRHEAVF